MISIEAQNLGKRFGTEWIFRSLDIRLSDSASYAVTGYNGSGKSTLLKILAGMQPPSSGKVSYLIDNEPADEDTLFRLVAMAAPYMDLVEEFTLEESIRFHARFKKLLISTDELIEVLGFQKYKNRQTGLFSSGMKQKLKLGLALYSKTPVLFLDEPTANLDKYNTDWYLCEMQKQHNRLIVISSNQEHEYAFCQEVINLPDYKD
jgi:ABC-type multidrug transport system ATPase subunit